MTEEMKFFLFLIEKYAQAKNRRTGDVLREWDEKGITDEIFDGYFQYHQERIENAYEDIDSLAATGKHADFGMSEIVPGSA
jgi:hypothetical protein